jgi:protein-L-isoaspartate(D-aspartate) O-methyltransferase
MDFAQARRMMVDCQVRTDDVTDLKIIDAMCDIPRERFVAADCANLAYLDRDLPVDAKSGRYLLHPRLLAKLVQAAEVGPDDKVLDVGCATGYSSALLARLAKSVVALEEDADLAARARQALTAPNIKVVSGPLVAGWPSGAPYDVILLNGAVDEPPTRLFGQLAEGGRLVCVVRDGPAGKAMSYRAVQGDVSGRSVFDANVRLLPGFAKEPSFVF